MLTGADNIAIGQDAGRDLTCGNGNIFIGNYAGANGTCCSYCVVIGHHIDLPTPDACYYINICNLIVIRNGRISYKILYALLSEIVHSALGEVVRHWGKAVIPRLTRPIGSEYPNQPAYRFAPAGHGMRFISQIVLRFWRWLLEPPPPPIYGPYDHPGENEMAKKPKKPKC